MIKQLALLVLIASIIAVNAQSACSANISGPNNASPARRAKRASASCSANISGPNNASPAKRQSTVCSGNGVCDGDTCVCNAGYEGDECETACVEPTTAAPTEAPTAAPTTEAPTAAPTTAAPTVAPTTDAPVEQTPAPTSASCVGANISGPNNASPAKRFMNKLRQAAVCSGNGVCNGQVCECNEGYSGSECENAPSTAAPTAAPSTAAPTAAPSTAAPSAAPTTAAPSTPAPTSGSCVNANISGPNNASPAKRQNAVCSGNGSCNDAQTCVCNAGWSGAECDVAATTAAPGENISGENNARASSATTVVLSAAALVVAVAAML